jgi:hypothetical protein
MKKVNILFSILMVAAIVIACEKKESEEVVHQHDEAGMTMFNHSLPVSMDSIAYLDTVFFSTVMHSENGFHGYEVTLQNLTTSEQTNIASEHIHAEMFTINDFWVNNVIVNSHMRANFVVAINHDGDTASYAIDFVCLAQ